MKNGFIIILAIFFCANLIAEPKVVFNDFDRIDVEYSDYLELKDLAENVAVILIPTFIDGGLHFPEIIDNGDGTYSLNTQPLTSIELNGASYDNSLAQVFDGDGDPANFPGSTLASYSEVGDYYVDTLNYQLYKKIDNDTWGNISTIVFVDSSPVENSSVDATIKFPKYEDSMRFLSDLDLFPGDSGGPVFDLNSMKVVGIVNASPSNFQVRTDFMWNSTDTCLLYNSDPTNHPWASDESVYVKAVYITEALKDNDGDSIHNIKDNCPDIPNPVVSYSLKSEFISGEFGAIANQLGQLGFEFSGFTWRYVYKMQPDSDLDGIGDACDYNSASGNGFANSRITNIKPQTPSLKDRPILFDKIYSQYTKINLTMPFGSGRESGYCSDNNVSGLYRGSICNAAVHYCAIDLEQKERGLWGTPGYCTTFGDSNSFFQYGFSHGSDNFSQESRRSWQSRISVADSSAGTSFSKWPEFTGSDNPNDDPARKEVTAGYSVFPLKGSETPTIWNWRRDWYEKNNCLRNPTKEICLKLKTASDYNESHTMYYALSTSILPVTSATAFEDIPDYLDSGDEINPAYFPPTNPNINARAARYSTYSSRPLELNYYRKQGWSPPPVPETIEIPEIEYCPSCYWNIPVRDFIDEQGIPEASSINHIGRWFSGKDENGSYQMSSQQLYFLEEMMFCSEMTEHEMVAVKTVELLATGGTEYQLLLNTSESGAAWESLGIINNWDSEITSIKTVVSTDTGLYFIAGTDSQRQYGQYLFRISVDGDVPEITDPENLPEITYSLQNLGLTGIGDDTLEDEKLVSIDGKLFVIGADSAGAGTRVFKLTNDDALFEEITGSAPVGRKIYNLKVSGKYVFLIGGMDDNNGSINDLWRFDTENEIWEQIPVTLQGDFRKVITQVVDGKLVMANPVIDGNTTHPAFEIDPAIENINDLAGNLNYVEIPVTEVEYAEPEFCVYEENNSIFPGSINLNGNCIPVYDYNYDIVSYFDYKRTIAGNGNNLYLGGLSGVRRVEIDENGDLENKELVITGEVHNLAKYENALYGANSGEIEIFSVEDDGSLTEVSDFDASSCKNLRTYNGKMFTAQKKKVKIYDLTDPFDPQLIKTISTSGKVKDLEIVGNTLYIYEETTSWFTTKGYTGIYDISDLDSPVRIKYFKKRCRDAEMQKSGEVIYLGCKNGQYRVEETGLVEVTGEKNYVREGYVYDGVLYQVFSGALHKSKVATKIAICGDGVIENDEVCEGDTIQCTDLDDSYVGGTANCNSTCSGYNEDSCEGDDGW